MKRGCNLHTPGQIECAELFGVSELQLRAPVTSAAPWDPEQGFTMTASMAGCDLSGTSEEHSETKAATS